jgi:competence protein ComGC
MSRQRGWRRVDILVVLSVVVPVVVVVVVPSVCHMKYKRDEIKDTQENDSRGKGIGDKSIDIGEY